MPTAKGKYRGTTIYALVYRELITAARYRGTVSYQDIAMIMGLPLQGDYMGKEVGVLLGEISEDEFEQDRPLLTAIAVDAPHRYPGTGFFSIATELGRLAANASDEEARRFWEKEKEAIYSTWRAAYGLKH